jgi:hypothetical protein
MTRMAGPLGVLPLGPATSTTEVEDDVDGRPLGRLCWRVWQRPPLSLKTMSMEPPPPTWEALPVGPVASASEF